MKNSKNKKKTPEKNLKYVAIAIVMVVLVSVLLFQFFPKYFKQTDPIRETSKPAEEKPEEIPVRKISVKGIEAAEKIGLFLETMESQDSYYWIKECSGQKTDNTQVQMNYWALMAYTGLYDSTNNEQYRQNVFSNWEKISKDDTGASIFLSHQLISFNKKFRSHLDGENKAILDNKIEEMGYDLASGIYEPGPADKAMIKSILARNAYLSLELSGKKTKSILDKADQLLNSAVQDNQAQDVLFSEKNIHEDDCWIKLAQLQKYRITNDETILANVRNYFDMVNFNEISKTILLDNSIPMNILSCSEALIELNEITGDKKYLDDSKEILKAYLVNNWDMQENKICNSDYAVTSRRNSPNLKEDQLSKTFSENAYLIYLLTNEKIRHNTFEWSQ
ncbi:hypothetical protein GF327_08150 [Candidatus Woesearchaeota archaeon]|nr:hypothetical protein [Candidatus Woesearchaeota archaeon]